MVNRDLLAAKLAELSVRVERVRKKVPSSSDALASDQDALDIVAFNLMQCVQICSDLSSHLIADEGWPLARTLGEGFSRLAEYGVISSGSAEAMRRACGLRNIVAHGYAGIDVPACYLAATAGIGDIERFAMEVSQWVTNGGSR